MAREHKVFISHAWAHHDELESLRRLIDARPYFNAEYSEVSRNEPINSTNAPYIKSVLKRKILDSNILIGLAGIYASHSSWMEWELDTALANGIPVIGVVPRGAQRISTMVSTRAVEVVRWNTESIIDAIRRHAR
ncbi:TIR domain-containing protein [Klebsiella pneumoniae]|uniref:TIR domain-containing protein n=1 Tax=Enterobacteriaceae TaxID=543 RepID=UPI0020066A6D|nr:TIR domain-containing protein [Klebsiella quasipneumoniae]ELC3655271.1 TIR domain-containing protein [Klebsiella pneumoniae]EMD1564423.1 TIR domain-containing protein [Enterobacter hormaechei]ELJ9622693.1 TIR domain-containing protein [Klebsiella pneumoniae]EMB0665135.1 TIR domain-containing protein [Klebsiella pneumoniae]EMD2065280.1 TIR domain-containing protein [Enterobacter hormaechei]